MLVYADDVALHQWVGPVAVQDLGLFLRAEGEEVVLSDEMCEVTPVLLVYVSHLPLEVLSTHLHLPLQTGLIADLLWLGRSWLYIEAVSG